MTNENSSSPAMGYQEILRRLAIVDEGFVGDHAGRGLGVPGVLLAIAPVIGLGRIAGAAPSVAGALGYDIEAALEEPDDP